MKNGVGKIVWLTGKPCSGKTTIANGLYDYTGFPVVDGDILRKSQGNILGFSDDARYLQMLDGIKIANYLAEFFGGCIVSLISPTERIRNEAELLSTADEFYLIHVTAPLSVLEKRDVKGMYKRARNGEIKNFTGLDGVYENPKQPDIVLDTDKLKLDYCIILIRKLIEIGKENDEE